MSDEANLDAESVTRNQKYDEYDHLKHLLKIGHDPNSLVLQKFIEEYNLQAYLKEYLKQNKA